MGSPNANFERPPVPVGRVRNVQQLIAACAAGATPEYVFFWGHRARYGRGVSKACLSQWYAAPFERDGVVYQSAEQFQMAEKAALFGDYETRAAILATPDPGEAKYLGRRVRNFDESVWLQRREDIVLTGSVLKFSANAPLRDYLLGTGDAVLVEASPLDRIWGIGLNESQDDARHPDRWLGHNLLGFTLMEARERLGGIA